MKKILTILFLFITYLAIGQVKIIRVASDTVTFKENLPVATQIYNIATKNLYEAKESLLSTESLSSASDKIVWINYKNNNADEADPLFQNWNKTDGINIYEKQIIDLDKFTSSDITGSESAFDGWDKDSSDDFSPTSLSVDYGFTDNSSDWNTAYGWGDHSSEGYLTTESQTLSDVLGEGNTTNNQTVLFDYDNGVAAQFKFDTQSYKFEEVSSNNLTVSYGTYGGVHTEMMRWQTDGVTYIKTPRIGTNTEATGGVIRYSSNVFEGYNGTAWVRLDSLGGGASLWNDTDPDGIYYTTGNVSIGTSTVTSSYLLRADKEIDGGYAAWFNNGHTSGNGVLIQGGNGSTEYSLRTMQEDGAAELFSVMGDGSLNLDQYGSGSFTGTAAKWLAVDASGNLIEEDEPSGLWTEDTNGITYSVGNVGIGRASESTIEFVVDGATRIYDNFTAVGVFTNAIFGLTETSTVSTPASDAGYMWMNDSDQKPYWKTSSSDYSFDLTSTSDFFKKKDFRLIDSPLNKILSLQAYAFNWKKNFPEKAPNDKINIELKKDKNKRDATGLVAQEVEKIIPEVVNTFEFNGYKEVDYDALVPYLIEAIKEQQKQIDELKLIVDELNK